MNDVITLIGDIDAVLKSQMDPRLKCEVIKQLIETARGD